MHLRILSTMREITKTVNSMVTIEEFKFVLQRVSKSGERTKRNDSTQKLVTNNANIGERKVEKLS